MYGVMMCGVSVCSVRVFVWGDGMYVMCVYCGVCIRFVLWCGVCVIYPS